MAYDIADNEINVYEANDPSTTLATITAPRINTLKEIDQVSYLGDELVYDTMRVNASQELTIVGGSPVYDTQLIGFPYGSMFHHTNAGGGIDRTFFLDTSKQVGMYAYEYDAVSIIGMLDRQIFPGHVYNRIYFYSVLEEIVGASGTLFDYDCTNVSQVLISGWIPYGTKRDALQQLLFATNIHAFWDTTNQRVVFDYISHTVAGTIADANIFDSGTVEYPQQATKIIVTEHAFFPYVTGNLVVAFDNSTGYALNGERVKFSNAPIIPSTIVTTGNITLSDITSDSAVVTGRGIVQAYQYTHTTFQTERNANVTDRKEYEVSVTNAYLISVLNSETVADRLADYYFNRFVVKDGIKLNGEEYTFSIFCKNPVRTTLKASLRV